MVCASYITGIFVVAGVSAIFLLRKSNREIAETALSLAMWIALFLVPIQMFLGDQHGQNTRQYQPMKLAAIASRAFFTARASRSCSLPPPLWFPPCWPR